MNTELKKLLIQNRIEHLKTTGKDNGPIIKKLERKQRILGN